MIVSGNNTYTKVKVTVNFPYVPKWFGEENIVCGVSSYWWNCPCLIRNDTAFQGETRQ